LEELMIAVTVTEVSQVAETRRRAIALAVQEGFNEDEAGRIALITTELATNLLKHGGGGEILASAYEENGATGIELVALDRGRGMANIQACLTDGFSSAGTAGKGLGAVARQSSFVDIASWVGLGTAVLARVASGKRAGANAASGFNVGAVSIAMTGEVVCGDSWAIDRTGNTATLLVADGLGHGPEAAEAAVEAVRLFHRFQGHQVPTLLDYIHGGLRATRGAAISVARYDPSTRQVVFAGIGNVSGTLASKGELRRMISMPGTAGYNVRKIQSFQYPFEQGLVILCSDGLSTGWTLDRYPNLDAVHPTLIAAILYRDFARRRDDATVLVGKWQLNPAASAT
jgi:anti-sigma regulatory factor (Ser/Thr protein kinase)